ncbi:MAG: hypothetical protein E7047_03860 [Lentisphaerae bacterium]|nr:hypothetical protein [Lentisphaerota bacterium]
MMNSCHFETQRLQHIVAAANKRAMYRAAGLMMRIARRKIHYRSYRIASAAGMPPYKHSKGANDFGKSIQFAVDPAGTTAVIGPARTYSIPRNISGPVPHTLEFGGITRPGKNSLWYQKNAPDMRTESALAQFFRAQPYAPLFMGTNAGQVAQASGSTRLRKKRAPNFSRSATGQYRIVYYLPVKMRSDRQARKVAKNVKKYFGYPTTTAGRVAPRPYMGPTLSQGKSKVLSFWKNVI